MLLFISLLIKICLQDVPYKPEEFYVKTRKCEPDAGADVVTICERQVITKFLMGVHILFLVKA